MLVVHDDDQALLDRYRQWRETGGKPLQWDPPPFELEIYCAGQGLLLYTWQQEKTNFELVDLPYFHLRYSACIRFFTTKTPRRLDRQGLEKRYLSNDHTCTRWFDLLCEAYERWWAAGRPQEFRLIA
jgi:hypothetical protein